jgi:trigger factor
MIKPPAVDNSELQVETEEVSPVHRKLTVTVPFSAIAEDLEQACQRLAFAHKVPGFRKGKTPLAVIRRKLGKEAIHDELYKSTLGRLLLDATAKVDIEPIASANCRIISFDDDRPLKFEAILPTKPKVSLGNYVGLTIWEPVTEVTDSDVDDELLNLRRKQACLEEKAAAAEMGDVCLVDIEAKIDGKRQRDKSFNNYYLELEAKGPDLHVVERLIGAKAGESRVFAINAPDEHGEPKKINYRLKLKKLRQRVLPQADKSFLAKTDCKSIEELRAKIKKALGDQKERMRDEYLTAQVLEKIIKQSVFEIAPEYVDMLASHHYEQAEANIRRDHQRSLAEHLEVMGQTEKDFRQDLIDRTLRELRQELILVEIAKDQNLEPTAEEIAGYAAETGLMPELFIDDAQAVIDKLKTLNVYASCLRDLRTEKALDWLVANVKLMKPQSAPSAASGKDAAGKDS